MNRRGSDATTESVIVELPHLFPYRVRPGQEKVIQAVAEVAQRGGPLLVNAPTGSGKTVAVLAPLLDHAERADHRILYLVRTHAQEVQVLQETMAISRRLERPILALGLQGRQRRCFLLEGVSEVKGATAEEHGKLCADRKRATEQSFKDGLSLVPPPELPEGGAVDLSDLDGCPYYARLLQSDVEVLAERFAAKIATPREFEAYCRSENLCPYELAKRLVPRARVITAPYAFFFHPHIRRTLYTWLGVGPDSVDLVVDEAHNLPDHLRDLTTVSLPEESVRRARSEVEERGDFQLSDGPSATRLLELVGATIDELINAVEPAEDGILAPDALEDALLTAVGGTSKRFDAWLGELAAWGESLRDERRRERHLPRSWTHAVALALLSWPQLGSPGYVKVAMRVPRRALEAYALDATASAAPVLECHLSVHMSGTLAPLAEYRDSLGLGPEARLLDVPSEFPPENRRILYDAQVTTRYEELRSDPRAMSRLTDRLSEVLHSLPVKTAVFFPSFEFLDRVLATGLQTELSHSPAIEARRLPTGDLWRSLEGFKRTPGGGILFAVAGGRISEGVDFPDDELEAVVVVGIPYPRPTAKREALRRLLEVQHPGCGWEYAYEAVAQRALLQSIGRMIRSEHDRGIAIILDRRAAQFGGVLPGIEPINDLPTTVRSFYGRRARWATPQSSAAKAATETDRSNR